MTIYFPVGNYGPVCDIIVETVEGPVQTEVFLTEPNIEVPIIADPTVNVKKQDAPKLCRTVLLKQLYRPDGDYGPVCDLNFGNDDSIVICPDDDVDPTVDKPVLIIDNPLPPDFKKVGPYPNPPGSICYYLADGTLYCVSDEFTPEQVGYPMPDASVTNKRDLKYFSVLNCGFKNKFDAWGEYRHTTPIGATYLMFTIIGAGGGAGGFDEARSAAAGAGNNSGGCGSKMKVSFPLNPNIENEILIVVGQGGECGINYSNQPQQTGYSFNRGGRGGSPGPVGLSGGGGGGGGSTDIFLNGRHIASVGGGGGGAGQACNYFKSGGAGKPWGNWNNFTWDGSLTTSSQALERTKYSPVIYPPVYAISSVHQLWSNWFRERVVWVNPNQDTLQGKIQEFRINLNFDVTGTYTFQVEADNRMVVYIASMNTFTDTTYINDNPTLNAGTYGTGEANWPYNSSGTLVSAPSTVDAGSGNLFYKVGETGDFTFNSETPVSSTYNVTTAGRKVVKFCVYNEVVAGSSWDKNPAGFAVRILKPNGTLLWDTKNYFGVNATNRTSGDGGGAGGGGGNSGLAGLNAAEMGYSGGSCSDLDSTPQGGSAGKSFILDHPSVTVNFFAQGPSGFHSGWQSPVANKDASVRVGIGGFGGGRPSRMSFVYNGTEYPLQNSDGSRISVPIVGMGQNVWHPNISGIKFPYHYFWGITGTQEGGYTNYSDRTTGLYEGAQNINTGRTGVYKPRSLELALWFRPVLSNGTWTTYVSLEGIPGWGRGTAWAVNDILPGKFPAIRTDGTQPWIDITDSNWYNSTVRGYSYFDKQGTYDGTYFDFSIKITQVDWRQRGQSGSDGWAYLEYGYME